MHSLPTVLSLVWSGHATWSSHWYNSTTITMLTWLITYATRTSWSPGGASVLEANVTTLTSHSTFLWISTHPICSDCDVCDTRLVLTYSVYTPHGGHTPIHVELCVCIECRDCYDVSNLHLFVSLFIWLNWIKNVKLLISAGMQ